MAGTKKKNQKKKAPGRTAKASATSRPLKKKQSFLKKEIGSILAAAVGVFLILSDLGLFGGAGDMILSAEKGLFGQGYILFAVYLIVLAVLCYREKGSFLFVWKLLCLTLMFKLILALFELMFAGSLARFPGLSIADLYRSSLSGTPGGGLIGGVIAGALRNVFGYVGAYFVIIVVLVIALVVLTEKSVVEAMRKGAGSTAALAKAGHEKYGGFLKERKERLQNERQENAGKSSLKPMNLSADSSEGAAGTDDPEIYLRYGREIIGSSQPGVSSLEGVKEPLRRRKYESKADLLGAGFDTGVIGAMDDQPPVSAPVNIKRLSYDSDAVPFEETKKEKYVSYAGILSAREFSASDAGQAGFAAGSMRDGSYSENESPSDTVRSENVASFDVFKDDEASEESSKETLEASFPEARAIAAEASGSGAAGERPAKENAPKPYLAPTSRLLMKGTRSRGAGRDELIENAGKLEKVLRDFGVGVTVTNIIRGPRVSRYELIPDTGVKVSRITSLEGDIKLALAASELRIEAPIPGKSAVGIEVPNSGYTTVRFRDIAESEEFKKSKSPLSWGIGLDIQGLPVVGDIEKMPHVLVAGTTGSGKSVGINTLIMSVLFKSSPDEVRMILIDPKVVELSVYNGIPHLLTEVVTKPDRALAALNWAVAEMNRRYLLFNETQTRNIQGYNEKLRRVRSDEARGSADEGRYLKLPLILIIIDELSELMMHSKKDVEQAIVSLSQLARAAGIHLVVATQRPSVDVVTGLIKSNIPSRIAYRLPSAVDSRTILDQSGAETLLGNGDMLFKPGDKNAPERVQGAFLSDDEVESVVRFVISKNTNASDTSRIDEDLNTQMEFDFSGWDASGSGTDRERDEYFAPAGRLIITSGKASIGALQRKFKIGFNRAARIMDELHEAGVVSDSEGTKERRILMDIDEFEDLVSGSVF